MSEFSVHDAINERVVTAVRTTQQQCDHIWDAWEVLSRENTEEHCDAERQPGNDEYKDDHKKGSGQSKIVLSPPLFLLINFDFYVISTIDNFFHRNRAYFQSFVVFGCVLGMTACRLRPIGGSYSLFGFSDFTEDLHIAESHD